MGTRLNPVNKHLRLLVYLLAFSVLCIPNASAAVLTGEGPFAVVELYTSQGCSSCPIADQFLRELSQSAAQDGVNLYTLSLHVTYWNYIGWKDPFSQEQFTERQQYYSRVFNLRNVYTPQMIVNGNVEFGGYRFDLAKEHIITALQTPPGCALTVDVERDKSEVQINYTVKNATPDAAFMVALTEKAQSNYVPNGENTGKTLSHSNIVHDLVSEKVGEKGQGRITLKIPLDLKNQQLQVTAFVQDRATMRILNAVRHSL